MNKKFALAFAALLCIASQGYARHPFVYDPISETPSVLVKADAAATPVAADQVVTAQPEAAPAVIESELTESNGAPMPSDGAVIESDPVMVTTAFSRPRPLGTVTRPEIDTPAAVGSTTPDSIPLDTPTAPLRAAGPATGCPITP